MFENKTYKKVEGRNLFKFSSGKFLPIAKRMTSGIPVYGGNGISWYTDETLVSFDTIVIGRVGAYCGNVMLVKGDKWITDNAIYISEFKTKDLKLEFLEKLMESYDFHSFSDSSAQPKITQRPLENQLYIVPPIELQEEYINQIKQIDKSKFLLQQILEKFELLKKSRFIEMFKNSETLRLDQIAEVTMGQSPDSSSYNSVGKGIPFYQGKTEFTDKYIGQPSTWCTSPTRIAKENDILMSVRAPVGNVNIATEECCIGRGLSSIRPQNGFNSEFIFEALEQKKEELENKATGSTFKAINKDIVLSIQIPNTSISIQKEYSNFVKQIDKSKFNVFQDQTATQVKVIVVLHHIC